MPKRQEYEGVEQDLSEDELEDDDDLEDPGNAAARGLAMRQGSEVSDDEDLSDWDDDDDSEFMFDTEDEDEDLDEDGAPKSKKKKELGSWKSSLKKVAREDIPEDNLHIVDWLLLIKHFAVNTLVVGIFIGFVFVSQAGAIMCLPLFLFTMVLMVIVGEFLMGMSIQVRILVGVLLFGASAGGIGYLEPYDFLQACAYWSFAPLSVFVSLLWLFERPSNQVNGGLLSSTRLWQALAGRRLLVVKESVELAALCKSIVLHRGGRATWLQKKVNKCREKCSIFESNVLIDMVKVDEANQEIPDVILKSGGQEVEPGTHVLTKLLIREEPSGNVDHLSMRDLGVVIRNRKHISDQKLDTWLNPNNKAHPAYKPAGEVGGAANVDPNIVEAGTASDNVQAASKKEEKKDEKKDEKKGGKEEVRVGQWIAKAQLQPTGSSTLIAQLTRVKYTEGLMEHWAARAAYCVVLSVILALPTFHIFMQIDMQRRDICNIGGSDAKGIQRIGDVIMCGSHDTRPCVEICKSLLTFAMEVHEKFNTSYIEMTVVFALLPLVIFVFCVRSLRIIHTNSVQAYLRNLRQSKGSVGEVVSMKDTFEQIFRLDFLWNRFTDSLDAWRGADNSLNTCGPISDAEFDLTATRGINDCFRQVLNPVLEMKSALSCEKTPELPFGIGYPEDDPVSDDDEEDKVMMLEEMQSSLDEITAEWDTLKFRNNLGAGSDRNFKVLFDLRIQTADSWELFKKWIGDKYSKQMDYIMANPECDAQDGGTSTHLEQNTAINDILLPRGFSFSHIYMQSHPEDGRPYQIELHAEMNKDGKPKGAKAFWDHCDALVRSLEKTEVDDDEEYDAEIYKSVFDYVIQDHPIIARFALSEQYYMAMPFDEVRKLCPDMTWNSHPPFCDFVDGLLKPQKFKVDEESIKLPPNNPDGDENFGDFLFYTEISVFMGDESPLAAMLAAAKQCWWATSVYIECLALAMLIPVLRLISGGDLFPKPYLVWSVLNTCSIWYQLVCFFSDFYTARARLGMVSTCLGILSEKTLAPALASKVDKPKEQGAEKKKDDERSKQRAQKQLAEDTKPFDLVVPEGATQKYEPGGKYWVREWRKKHDNVANWHLTVSYLRVFVSTSRLTAQTILASAAVFLGFLMLLSLMQAANGHGPPILDVTRAKERTLMSLDDAAESGFYGAKRLHENIEDAVSAMANERVSNRLSAVGAEVGRKLGDEDETTIEVASRRLHKALHPVHAYLHGALVRQGHALSEGHRQFLLADESQISPGVRAARDAIRNNIRRLKEMGHQDKPAHVEAAMSVAKATKTQIFTIAMVAFVLLYSVPLMFNIVLVNGHFDKHDDLLLKMEERHTIFQNRREIKKTGGNRGTDGAGGGPGVGPTQTEISKEGAEVESKEGVEGETGTRVEHDVDEPAPDPVKVRDPGCKRYEKMLKMAIHSSRKTKERFPLKLFGFVISFQLLATWIGLAAAPMISEAQKMAKPAAVVGCNWLEHSKMVHNLQKQVTESNPKLHMNVSLLIHDNICQPMESIINSASDRVSLASKAALTRYANAAQNPPPHPHPHTTRRLLEKASDLNIYDQEFLNKDLDVLFWHDALEMPDLTSITRKWWRANQGPHAEAKYAAARAALLELGRQGDRLLSFWPRHVAQTFKTKDGGVAYISAMGAIQPQIDAAVADYGYNGGHASRTHDEL